MADEERHYTVAQAARRVGRSQSAVRAWIHDGRVTVVPDTDPRLVAAADIERLRTEHLAIFDDVLDITPGRPESASHPTASTEADVIPRLRERVATLEAQLRQIIASRATTNEGLQQLLRGEQGLLDAVLSTIPVDHPTLSSPRD